MKENFGAAADTSRGRFSGRVYATWEVGDLGARLSFVNGQRVRVEEGTHRSVAISWSDDHRQTWASPVSLEVAGAGPSYMSTVAVAVIEHTSPLQLTAADPLPSPSRYPTLYHALQKA